jgi:hypothetical protein
MSVAEPRDRAALWDRLRSAGFVTGDCPVVEGTPVPWYVRAMLGVAGWIAAVFLLGFVGTALAFVARSGPAAVTVGLLLCAAAVAALLVLSAQEFFAQFALAVSLAGQALVAGGLMQTFPGHDGAVYVAVAGFETVLVLLAPYSVHRTWCAFAAALAVFLALHEARAAALFPGLAAGGFVALQLAETRRAAQASLFRATSAGVVLALLATVPASSALDASWLGGQAASTRVTAWTALGALLVAAVLAGTAASLVARSGVALSSRAGLATVGGALAFGVAAWPVPGVLAAVVVTVSAFAAGRAAMTGLGLLATAAALSHYYYSLEASLLAKAASLLAAGAVLIACRYAFRAWIGARTQEAGHA